MSQGTVPRPDQPRGHRAGAGWRFLRARLAARQRSGLRTMLRRVARAFALTLLAALLALPFALAWGVGHARVEDYLGPHRATLTTDFSGDVEIDLGPLGNVYLPSPAAPIGVHVEVGGVSGTVAGNSLFSNETLSAYAALYADPHEVVAGITERVAQSVIVHTTRAELVLMLAVAAWLLRRRLLAPGLVRQISRRRMIMVWAGVSVLVVGSVLAPTPAPATPRIPVALNLGGTHLDLTVDNVLLSDLLTRGISGVELLSERQAAAVQAYVDTATVNLSKQLSRLPKPAPTETMIFGYSDLHCNQAMTTLLERVVAVSNPALVLSSGDDTVQGTAAERGCITREVAIAGGRPLLDSPGNHDSTVTAQQMEAAGMIVMNGHPVRERKANITVLGDSDPEHNIPFSVDRFLVRPETEEQMGKRLVQVATASPVDVIMVHQPAASAPVLATQNPPARLVLWGHMHAQAGPYVVKHSDGTWTVGMQQGTAGGVKQPTITSFSTPFSPPLVRADCYFFFRDNATGLITAVQPVHFNTDGTVEIADRIETGRLSELPPETRDRLVGTPSPTPN
jgi:hypothetical protein